ncbi:MAG: aspartate carbamoyltransferase [Pseudomonadales bacterium]
MTIENRPKPPRHVLSADQFDRPLLNYLYVLTNRIRRIDKSKEGSQFLQNLLNHRRAMLYFTQPSTRTFLSFQSACHILGITGSDIRDSSTSSERKGESIEDTLRTFSSYVDLVIMRSPVAGLCNRIAELFDSTDRPVPIINAGSGPDEHPTQALLDIYTLQRSFKDMGSIDGKTICMVGDLKRGRTVRSLSQLLAHYNDVHIKFVSPPAYAIEDDLRHFLATNGVNFSEEDDLLGAATQADAIYMTRVQDEYGIESEVPTQSYQRYHLKAEHLPYLKDTAVIMHPLPRREELDSEIDKDPRAKYWRQERNGMWTRTALITMLLGVDDKLLYLQPKLTH